LQPIGEAPDEPTHVEFIRYIQEHGRLPKGDLSAPAREDALAPGHEFDQTPLYYLLLAPALSPIWLPPGALIHRNPFIAWTGHPWQPANDLHWTNEGWPYQGMSLFVHTGRLLSTVLGLVALLATYGLAVLLVGRRSAALFATGWLGLTPAFLLTSSWINNDASATAWSAVTIFLCAWLLTGRSASPLVLIALSLALAAALLSKLDTGFLVPLAFVAAASAVPAPGFRWSALARRIRGGLLVLLFPLGLVAAWWLVYGRTFAPRLSAQAGFSVAQPATMLHGFNWARLPQAIAWLNNTWWGGIGASVEALWPPWLYLTLALPVAMLLGGGLVAAAARSELFSGRRAPRSRGRRAEEAEPQARRSRLDRRVASWISALPREQRTLLLLCLATVPLLYAVVARQVFPSVGLDSNARFILPVAPIIAVVVTVGGMTLPFGRYRQAIAIVYLSGLFLLAIATAGLLFPRLSDPVVPARLAESPREVAAPPLATYANGVELLAIPDRPAVLPVGHPISVTLRWRVATPLKDDFIVFVHVLGQVDSRQLSAGRDEIPFEKLFPPTLWQVGEIVDERQDLSAISELSPGIYTLKVGLYHLDASGIRPIPVTGPGPVGDSATVDSWRVLPQLDQTPAEHVDNVRFGPSLILRGHNLVVDSDGLHARLFWEAASPITRQLVVSVQVLDEAGRLVAQHDGEPVDGRLPTPTWRAGEVVRDDHLVRLPGLLAGRSVTLVVYDSETGQRLLVSGGKSEADRLVLDP
jgi:Dolichyl-phosphate-mannose-protein mannosyltransferase